MSVLNHLQSLLDESLYRHGLPGASLAVLADGRLYEAAAGHVNTRTCVPCTADSIFMFGSVTKTVTATMALRLMEQGKFALDDPACDHIPEFAPRDQTGAETIRMRHLLTHTSGLMGSIFQDTGRNADALSKQIDLINGADPFHNPGDLLSYCNSGYLLLGRAIEVATQSTWDEAVQSLAGVPLETDSIVTRPEQALRFNTAIGHVIDPDTGAWIPIAEPFAGICHGPAGATMAGRARDLVNLAQAYLNAEILTEATVNEAWSLQADPLAPSALRGWGLGWMLFDWQGETVIGHDGSTAGAKSFLRISPDNALAVALLVNAQAALPVYEDVMGAIFRELADAWETLADDMPDAPMFAIEDCVGAYADSHLRVEITIKNGAAYAAVMPNAANPIHRPVLMTYPVHPFGPKAFYATGQGAIFYPLADRLDTKLVRTSRLAEAPNGDMYLCSGANIYRRLPT